MFTTTLYEGSAIYIFLIALGIFGHSFLSKSLPHDKIQLHLPSKSSSANFQSFCPPRSIVKEVPFLYIEMTWNLYSSFICPNYHPPPNCSSVKSSMWAQVQFIFYGQIGTLQSKCYLDPSYYPQTFRHSSIPKSLPHDNIQLNFPSKSFSGNFQSFYLERSFVK